MPKVFYGVHLATPFVENPLQELGADNQFKRDMQRFKEMDEKAFFDKLYKPVVQKYGGVEANEDDEPDEASDVTDSSD